MNGSDNISSKVTFVTINPENLFISCPQKSKHLTPITNLLCKSLRDLSSKRVGLTPHTRLA